MPSFEPFRGARYAGTDPALVTSPPYDVIDDSERARLASRHPANAVRVDVPQGDYAGAAATFRGWLADGTLAVDGDPGFYLYRMTFDDEAGRQHATLGVIGALGLEPPGTGDVLPHERTTPKARSDRLDLLRATEANLSPIWGLSLAEGLSKLLDPGGAERLGRWHDDEGVGHELWRLADPGAVAAVRDAVEAAPVVIADGHHRYETCLEFAAERPELAGARATLCFVVELVEDQLTVQPIHRLIADLAVDTDLPAVLSSHFELGPVEALPGAGAVDRLVAEEALGLVTPDGWRLLRPRAGMFETVADLDSSRLDAALAGLGAHDLQYQHGVANCVDAVRSGRAGAAVLLRPVSVRQIRAVADARDRMPPKSTFFWPKPRTGAVFRLLAP